MWDVLTDYEHLSDVIPNLVKNDVVQTYEGLDRGEGWATMGRAGEGLASRYPGARLRQTGAAQLLPGIKFQAKLTLDVVGNRNFTRQIHDFTITI